MSKSKFNPGQIVSTNSISEVSQKNPEFASFVSESMRKHITGDWGDLDAEDKKSNDDGLDEENPGQILSEYNFQQLPGIIPDNLWYKYGSWLRRNDPIAFEVGYNDKNRNLKKK